MPPLCRRPRRHASRNRRLLNTSSPSSYHRPSPPSHRRLIALLTY
ncbi:hypothetical protein MtrunA17_Chr7g0271901 [Medicago truncatula]|uniref:Uncharacterized protein n=1 Tax=Medicago truncatula TaxID=3880 RepID=A0A396H8Z3_MEDTR|nr:hypothetical protein MtrunA17_Chr7g0271901 [Medicago truncatula]